MITLGLSENIVSAGITYTFTGDEWRLFHIIGRIQMLTTQSIKIQYNENNHSYLLKIDVSSNKGQVMVITKPKLASCDVISALPIQEANSKIIIAL